MNRVALKPLLNWQARFFLANTFLCWLIAVKYLFTVLPLSLTFLSSFGGTVSLFGKIIIYIFFIITYIGHFALLAFLVSLPLWILILLWPRPAIIISLAILIYSLLALVLLADAYMFAIFRFHLGSTIIHMAIAGGFGHEVLDFSTLESILFASIIGVIFLIEIIIAVFMWKKTTWITRVTVQRCSITFALCLFFSYALFIFGSSNNITQFAKQSVVFPWYGNMLATILPMQNSQAAIQRLTETGLTQLNLPVAQLHYPLHPLVLKPAQPLPNIIIIGIDTWRFDMLTQAVTPNIYQFAQNSLVFTQHSSGGNATQPGLFALFYSLPSNYWSTMLDNKVAPLLLDELQKLNYQMGIFVSANLIVPPFYKTIFVHIPDLQTGTPGSDAEERDRYITQEFTNFINNAAQQHRPIFSFVFYDSAHAYCTNQTYPKPFQPAIEQCNRLLFNNETDPIPYLNRHKNSLHFIDSEVAKLFAALQANHLMDNSIIIITGDHGQEFNDNHRNYWEHAGNFTRYQIQTPLIIRWPGKPPQVITYPTSHYDIVPTLMQLVLHCQNPIIDYSIGKNLFDPKPEPFLIVGSYAHMGIITDRSIYNLLTSGDIEIQNLQATPQPQIKPNTIILQQAFALMRKY